MTDEDKDEAAGTEPEKVGYGRPPREHQFKLGQSGNPRGRPKKSRTLKTVVEEELLKTVEVKENGRRHKRKRLDVMVAQTVAKAMQGDVKAFSTVMGLAERTGAFGMQPEAGESLLTADDQTLIEEFLRRHQERDVVAGVEHALRPPAERQ